MPTVPLVLSSCPRLRAICDSADNHRNQETVAADAARAMNGARNATWVPPRRRFTGGLIRVETFNQELAKATPSLRCFDSYACSASSSFPSQALDFYEKVHEYRCAANALLVSISPEQDANDAQNQRQTLRRLMRATQELRVALLFWDRISQPPGPLQQYLNARTCEPSPRVDVQARLANFAVWLDRKHTLFCSQHRAAVRMSQAFRSSSDFRTLEAVEPVEAVEAAGAVAAAGDWAF